MAEIATIARPYAEALFKSHDPAQLESALEWVEQLGELAANPELRAYIANPATTNAQVMQLLDELMPAKLNERGRNFVKLLLENKRFTALPEVAKQFRVLKNQLSGTADALVESAFALDAQQEAELKSVLEQRFGKKLKLQVQSKPELIGGVRVVVGDEVLDTSVQARLAHMKAALLA